MFIRQFAAREYDAEAIEAYLNDLSTETDS